MPVALCAGFVSTTLAPRKRISFRRSIEKASDIAEEYYVSFLLDRTNRSFLAMASIEGGVDIEEVAATKPEALAKIRVDALEGVTPALARDIADAAHMVAGDKNDVFRSAVIDFLAELD